MSFMFISLNTQISWHGLLLQRWEVRSNGKLESLIRNTMFLEIFVTHHKDALETRNDS